MADDDDFVLNLQGAHQPPARANKRPDTHSQGALNGKQAGSPHSNRGHQVRQQQHNRNDAHHGVPRQGHSNGHTAKPGGSNGAGPKNSQPYSRRGPAPGKGAAKKHPKQDDDLELKAADSDEENEVASLVAMVAQRDAAMEKELSARGQHKSREQEAVVDFEDDDADRRGKKQRKFAPVASEHDGDQHPAAGPSKSKASGGWKREGSKPTPQEEAMKQQPTKVTVTPGQFTHGGAGNEGAGELFESLPSNGKSTSVANASGEASTWTGLGLDTRLCEQLATLNFERPTRVQAASIPPLVQGKDLLVRAATGSGKTLSYLVPIIQDLIKQEPRLSRAEGTYALVIAPTRELCLQIQDVAQQLLKRFHWLVAGVVIGGENRTHEKARLRKGVTLLMASPGRLADHLHSTTSFKIDELRWLILDEADRLLDLGFEARLKEIVELLDAQCKQARGGSGSGKLRTTALLSATLHSGLSTLASMSLKDPVAVGFTMQQGASGLELSAAAHPALRPKADLGQGDQVVEAGAETYVFPSQLRQSFMEVEAKQRLVTLAGLLRQKLLGSSNVGKLDLHNSQTSSKESKVATKRKAVVFISSCDGVELHHTLLGGSAWRQAAGGPLLGSGMPLLKLHGDMPQAQRTAAFVAFTRADQAVLLCTDVAARGLDFPDVTVIIQYDVPGAPTEYVHRVGRTARMGHTGEAILFLMPHERAYTQLLGTKGVHLSELSAEGPLRWLPKVAASMDDDFLGAGMSKGRSKGQGLGGYNSTALSFAIQRSIMKAVGDDTALRSLASDAFRSFVRAYATHSGEVKKWFHVKNLHLGHVAFAHGLKVTPTTLGASGSSAERKRKRAEELDSKQRVAKKQLYKKAATVTSG